jgi:hypothetical protein
MTIFEIDELFPNGLHDAEVESIHIDYVARTVIMTVDVWIGALEDPAEEREAYRRGTLEFRGLQYCAMDVPDERYPYAKADGIRIDLAEATAFTPPGAAFTCRFWVNEWNGFVHLAAQEASFSWTAEAVNRRA